MRTWLPHESISYVNHVYAGTTAVHNHKLEGALDNNEFSIIPSMTDGRLLLTFRRHIVAPCAQAWRLTRCSSVIESYNLILITNSIRTNCIDLYSNLFFITFILGRVEKSPLVPITNRVLVGSWSGDFFHIVSSRWIVGLYFSQSI